ncbi:hypothetical protein [Salinibacter ruber]|uniref:DUF3899 domain-containing protein n=1 Tax=Salinibacter ruber TaxID=146919 RepID=A0A9X2Z9E6_9BACT|nr:hypothetical protein [Salinibacter ruber]MBB4089858.1 hypothetical protein [Salinibacter ruber]MCS3610358.1 hypothetical protein [Salinibacter ruber]MCS3614977.1 hypothetical protein [Salinibacter ruber]MCS3673899.1 hypothetical protein [Salinibacter ruber]MCS3783161.1 hypothetical protein [Salinibacter ruber]
MFILEGSVLVAFGVVSALTLVLLGIVGQATVRLYRHHASAAGLLGAIALLWTLSITYNLRVLARLADQDARLASLPLIGAHVRTLRRAEETDRPLRRTFERFARWYPPYLVLFGALFGAVVVIGSLGA